MFGNIIKTTILTIFAIIILHFTIEHTRDIWYIPKNIEYEPSYKKIIKLLDKLPDKLPDNNVLEKPSPEDNNSIASMENKLNEYIINIT